MYAHTYKTLIISAEGQTKIFGPQSNCPLFQPKGNRTNVCARDWTCARVPRIACRICRLGNFPVKILNLNFALRAAFLADSVVDAVQTIQRHLKTLP